MSRTSSLTVGVFGALLALAGCSGPTDPSMDVGTVRVTTSTVGLILDPDGYQVALAGSEPVAIGQAQTVSLTVPSGFFSLTLTGQAANCTPVGDPVAGGSVAAGATADVRFDLVCFRDPIAFDGPDGVTVIDAGGGPTVILGTPGGRLPDAASGTAWNPSRTRLAYIGPSVFGARDLNVVALNKSERFLSQQVMGEPALSWSPDGAKIAIANGSSGGDTHDARLLAVDADLSGTTQTLDASWPGADRFSLSWSPDGSRIVYTAYSFEYGGANDDELWVVEGLGQPTPLWGAHLRPIEFTDQAPNWSPDGTRIAFQRWDHGERSELWVIDADGSNPRLLTAANDASLSAPLWAPDGSVLVFFRDGQLWRMLPDGTSMAPVTDSYAVAASWSPSVTFGGPSSSPLRLAISEASDRIVLVGLDGSGRTVLANGTNAHWR